MSAYAEKHHNIPESTIWQFIIDLLKACKHLHDRNLVHMDIKPDNIFISFDGLCKLGDFGLVIDLEKVCVQLTKRFYLHRKIREQIISSNVVSLY